MKKKYLFIFFFIINVSLHKLGSAETITLVANPWCPYNCAQNNILKGYLVEIAELAFSHHNIKVTYITLPWSRALIRVLDGKSDGLIGVTKSDAPQLVFPNQELGIAKQVFFTKNNSSWKYTGLKSLDEISLGVIRDYSYGDFDEFYIAKAKIGNRKVQAVVSVKGLEQNIAKLKKNRISALIEDRNVFNFFLLENNIKDTFREAGVAAIENIYIAFSPVNPKAEIYAQLLSQEIEKMRFTGQLDEILKKYNLKDWQINTDN